MYRLECVCFYQRSQQVLVEPRINFYDKVIHQSTSALNKCLRSLISLITLNYRQLLIPC